MKKSVFPLFTLTLLTLLAFAGNSLLCRLALKQTNLDAATFTSVRLASGALALWLIALNRPKTSVSKGNWASALALFVYAAAFSFAYMSLTVATGALLLFGAVQGVMTGYSVWHGEQLSWKKIAGMALAVSGLIGLLLPGLAAPPPGGSVLMLAAGVAWGVYTLRGKTEAGDPVRVTAGNFLRATPMAAVLSLATLSQTKVDPAGIAYAMVSGALASAAGYILWYTVLPSLKTATAATLQLSVPVLAAIGGILILREPITLRLALASVAVLGGILLVIRAR